jgi:hypothetical protein
MTAKGPGPHPLRPCGTEAAYRRHRRRGEEACPPCRAAHVAYVLARRPRPAPRALLPCGTEAAYRRHRRRGEPACRPCLDASAVAELRRRRRRPA